MRISSVVVVTLAVVVLILAQQGECNPLFKVFCAGIPVYRGRIDTIVYPGVVSPHVHKVAGGSNFGPSTLTESPVQAYNDLRASPCTTCSINKVDMSAYWHPDLYYRWPNGSLSLVPKGGLTVYYLFRNGDGDQAKPKWQAFPAGFRMVSGNPYRRSFDNSTADKAISFACLSEPGGPESPSLDLVKTRFCKNGLRLQLHFPQCWDGINVDSPTHNTHVAFPTEPDNGNCPSTHPVRLPNLFFEAFYSVDMFPHGTGTQPFVVGCGDGTGYGFHGDFLSGWDVNVLQAAINDPSCEATNTNNGNTVTNCKPLAPYVQQTPEGACPLNKDIQLTEHIGFGPAIPSLPGNNPITGAGNDAPVLPSGNPGSTYKADASVRFHLRSVLTGKYLTSRTITTVPLPVTSTKLTYHEVFVAENHGGLVAIMDEYHGNYLTAGGENGRITADRFAVSDWELFKFVNQANGRVAIVSNKNEQYLTVQSDNTLSPTSTTIGDAQLFERIQPNGGSL